MTYTTDIRPGMTARQRAAIERHMARDRMTLDETGKLIQNWTPQNAERPAIATPRNDLHIHIHDGDDDDPASEAAIAARRPAMREPGLDPNNEALADLAEQVAALNIAVARMAQGQGMGLSDDPNQMGEGEANQFPPSDPNEIGDVVEQAASQKIANSSDQIATPASMQKANEGFWNTKGRTTTGMSGSVPPNSRGAEANNYQPGAAGTINSGRRLSTVAKVDEMQGRTSGWGTSDMRMQDRAMFWRQQRVQTNSAIAKINRRNAVARQNSNSWGV